MLTYQNFGSYVLGVAFHPTKNLLASCSADTTIRTWDITSGSCLSTLKVDSQVLSVAYSPDGTKLTAGLGYPSYSMVVFDTQTNEQICSLNVGSLVWSVSFSPAGDIVAAGCDDGTVQLIDVATAEVKRTMNVDGSVSSIDFAPCGNKLAAAFNIYQYGSLKEGGVKIFSNQGSAGFVCQSTLRGHSAYVYSVCFSSDGKLTSGSEDSTVRNWNPATRASLS